MTIDLGVNIPYWQDHGECFLSGLPAELWMSHGSSVEGKLAIKICKTCRVKQKCLDFALELENDVPTGIFGGLTSKERIRLQRNKKNGKGTAQQGSEDL